VSKDIRQGIRDAGLETDVKARAAYARKELIEFTKEDGCTEEDNFQRALNLSKLLSQTVINPMFLKVCEKLGGAPGAENKDTTTIGTVEKKLEDGKLWYVLKNNQEDQTLVMLDNSLLRMEQEVRISSDDLAKGSGLTVTQAKVYVKMQVKEESEAI
jgi:hypothetical protein